MTVALPAKQLHIVATTDVLLPARRSRQPPPP
jgi:hypothetical protein